MDGDHDIAPSFMKKKDRVVKTKEEELAWFYKLSLKEQQVALDEHFSCFRIHMRRLNSKYEF